MYKTTARHIRAGINRRTDLLAASTKRANRSQPPTKLEIARRLYLVEFVLNGYPTERFFKIGITGGSIATRFAADLERYSVNQIAVSVWLKQEDAFALEGAFHCVFAPHRHRPAVPLSSGNTECYGLNVAALGQAVSLIEGQKVRLTPDSADTPPVDPIGGDVVRRKSGGFYRQPVGKAKRKTGRALGCS